MPMTIEPRAIKVRDIFSGYSDSGDDGVFAYDGRLAIRPAYQREFVYDEEQAEAVIHTVMSCTGLKPARILMRYWTGSRERFQ